MPLGVPVTHLDYEKTENGRDYSKDFMRFLECQAGTDGKPLYITEGGVGGVMGFELISPDGIQKTTEAAHEKGGAVLFDNVQVMPFRTGDNMLSVDGLVRRGDWSKTTPDMVTGAKGNGGGYPFAFMAARKAFLDRAGVGHFGKSYDTYGRNLTGVTAFNTIYEIMTANGFRERIQEGINRWRTGLETIKAQNGNTRRVTGKGYMSGLQLCSAEDVGNFRKIGMEKTGIIVCAGGIRGDILRLGIKLDSPDVIIDEGLNKIEDTLKKMQNETAILKIS